MPDTPTVTGVTGAADTAGATGAPGAAEPVFAMPDDTGAAGIVVDAAAGAVGGGVVETPAERTGVTPATPSLAWTVPAAVEAATPDGTEGDMP